MLYIHVRKISLSYCVLNSIINVLCLDGLIVQGINFHKKKEKKTSPRLEIYIQLHS